MQHRKSVQERSVRLLEQVKATPTTPQEGEGDANGEPPRVELTKRQELIAGAGPGLSREELQRRVASSMITEVQSAFSRSSSPSCPPYTLS